MGQVPTFHTPEGLAELKAALEADWPSRQAALRASGVPLNDETEEEKAARETAEAESAAAAKAKADAEAAAAKPWGDEKDFDPDKAWKLIENVRGDAAKLKSERDALAQKVKEHDDASKTDAEKREERATEAEKKATAATLEAARLRVALKKGLTETQAKRLVGDTEEDLGKDADDLLASFKNDDEQDSSRRPRERLRPGAVASAEAEENDPAKLAAMVPRRYG